MQKLDPIEAALARLMPPGLSQQFQIDLEDMIDDLAAEDFPAATNGHPFRRWMIAGGIAAAVAAVATVVPFVHTAVTPASVATTSSTPADLVLVVETDRVESMTDEGWQENPDGSAMHAVRINVVEENSLRDEETGIVLQVSEPREELFLMPISSF